MRLLLVEDDALLGAALAAGLKHAGHAVDWVRDADLAAAAVATTAFDAVVLDLGLPRRDGLDLLRRWRGASRTQSLPVLIITARDRIDDRVTGLDAGADDYMVKPIDLDELAARLRAIERRRAGAGAPQLVFGRMVISPAERRVLLDGADAHVTARECALLMALAKRPTQTLSVDQLREALYSFDDAVDSNAIEVHVHNLRRKLGRSAIVTQRGFGYRIGTA